MTGKSARAADFHELHGQTDKIYGETVVNTGKRKAEDCITLETESAAYRRFAPLSSRITYVFFEIYLMEGESMGKCQSRVTRGKKANQLFRNALCLAKQTAKELNSALPNKKNTSHCEIREVFA